MDKTPIYPGAIPLDTNWLQPQRNTEIALGYLMQAAFGVTTLIDGLAVTPTSPASLAVQVGAGSIITLSTVDTLTSGFGSLAVDNTTPLVKIGVNTTATTMAALTAPVVAGQSQNWLLEAKFLEADGTPVVLPYYNSTNPALPYSGPANTGATNNTARTNRVQFQWVAGTAAATGTQNTPTPDAGWVGVAIVTVITNQTTITSSSITPYSAAPLVPTKMSFQRIRLSANLNVYVAATGGSDTSNSGLSASSPFLTLQRAWNYIFNNLDLNGYTVTVNIANGTYSNNLQCQGSPLGGGPNNPVAFVGNVGSPGNVVISTSNAHGIVVSNGANISISGMTIQASGGTSYGLLCNTQSIANINGAVVFGACSGTQIRASQGSLVFVNASYSITGSSPIHINATGCSQILYNTFGSNTITLTGTPAYSIAFAVSDTCSYIQTIAANWTFSGSATGVRYSAYQNAVIATGGAGASFFPGSVAGSTATGGQYT